MRLVKQLFRHDPANGIYGDCQRTVLACLLDLDPETVPHVHRELKAGEQAEMHDAFLQTLGVVRICIPITAPDVGEALVWADFASKGLPYCFSGTSRSGTNHVVIGKGREIIWDPSQIDSGIVGPQDDGYYWVEFLVRPA